MTKCTAPIDPDSIVIPKKPANKSASEHRKITKPIMEKRRRARINHSLEQLKCILIEQFSECSKKNNNLEKADILEMTVKYLKDITAKKQNNRLKSNIGLQQNNGQQVPASSISNNVLIHLDKQQLNKQQAQQQVLSKKGIQLMQSGFKDCKQQVSQCLSKVDKQLNERLSNHLAKIEKQQFEQAQFKLDCNQVLNLSINEHNLMQFNNNASSFLLHTPSSACSSSSSTIFFPQNCATSGGSLSPGSDRSLSPSSLEPVWRPW